MTHRHRYTLNWLRDLCRQFGSFTTLDVRMICRCGKVKPCPQREREEIEKVAVKNFAAEVTKRRLF